MSCLWSRIQGLTQTKCLSGEADYVGGSMSIFFFSFAIMKMQMKEAECHFQKRSTLVYH